MNRSFLYLLFIVLWSQSKVTAQNALEIFGKNKVQYNDDLQDWWIYETNNIVYYWYGKSRNLAQFYINLAENENQKIRTFLRTRFFLLLLEKMDKLKLRGQIN